MTATDLLPLGVSRRGLVPGLRNIKEVDGRDKPADDCFQCCRNTAV